MNLTKISQLLLIGILLFSCNESNNKKEDLLADSSEVNHDKPNVIIIYADDLGYGDVSAYGAKALNTPNIDKLANEGLMFTNGHCASATCTPSRYAMLTGNYAFRKKGTGVLNGDAGLIIPTDKMTLPKVFKNKGYKTAVVGKWHLGLGDGGAIDWNQSIKPGPNEVGFDYSFIFPATADRVPTVYLKNHDILGLEDNDPIAVSYRKKIGDEPTGKENPELLKMPYTPGLGHDGTIVNGISRMGFMEGGTRSRWTDEELAHDFYSEAEDFIINNQEESFFLFFSLSDIHVPRMPDTRFKGASGLGYRGDAVLQLDDTTGRIMRLLEYLNIEDNTIVIFSSDNGPILDDGYVDGAITEINGHKPSGIYRSGKYSIFEGGTRVPTIIRWPNKIKAGSVSDAMVSQVDFLASFADYFGVPLDKEDAVDSFNIWDAFVGISTEGRSTMIEHARTLAFLENEWKYIQPKKGAKRLSWAIDVEGGQETGNSEEVQLYNLKEDPKELNNIAEKHPEKVAKLKEALENALAEGRTR
ncbi:arylsulfatase [Joostella atrarenae]|uniref:Arylsulfatase n=1 Tax=Joostella atrarenae TaxID=679257 RepID=A0ABS9J5S6_9FLAO|nr:arylsulfatase [Joostella atrarenae]MCF8715792.1 arylsulfatase [Joostella atrarenae]